jgi:uncharacterized protein YkwD
MTQQSDRFRDKLTNYWLIVNTPRFCPHITALLHSQSESSPRKQKNMITTRLFYFARQQTQHLVASGNAAKAHVVFYPSNQLQSRLPAGRFGLWWAVACALVWAALMLTTLPAAAQQRQLYVPMVGTGAVAGTGEQPVQCGLNEQEQAIAQLMLSDPNQQRQNPVCDPILAQVARARARDMALRGYFGHTDPDGNGPNIHARNAGYPLPDWYGTAQDSNNIESIGGGYPGASDLWQGWLNSEAHRIHVLGTEAFYGEQRAYGIGYYYNEDSQLKHYWVFLSAPVAE